MSRGALIPSAVDMTDGGNVIQARHELHQAIDFGGAPDQLCEAVNGPYWTRDLPRGVVVAIGRLVDCEPAERVAGYATEADRTAGNFARGRYAWRIEEVQRLLTPVPLVGRQGLFNWTPEEDLDPILGPKLDHGAACRHIGWA